jgi:hypothetical protein
LEHPEKVEAVLLVDASGQPDAKSGELPLGFRLMRMPVIKEAARFIAPRSIFESSIKTSMSVQSKIDDKLVDRYWELNRYPGNRAATMQRFSSPKSMTSGTKEGLSAIKVPRPNGLPKPCRRRSWSFTPMSATSRWRKSPKKAPMMSKSGWMAWRRKRQNDYPDPKPLT